MTDVSPERSTTWTDKRILAQHNQLHELIRQVGQARHLGALLQCLAEVRAVLEPHFSLEEAPGGFFEVVASRDGRHLAAVAALRDEHDRFLREIDLLAKRAREVVMGPVAAVLKQAEDFARRLERHESRESEILADTIYGDSGQGG